MTVISKDFMNLNLILLIQILVIKMRSSKNMRLMNTDLNRLQKSLKQKTEKQVESLKQLIELPDFDVSQFFQTLMRSSTKYEDVLQKIPIDKQIDFFSRNFVTFIQTQEQLAQLKLPQLEEIPKAKQFKFEEVVEQKKVQDCDQQSVLEIIDNFGAAVLQKNSDEIIRILAIINEMKQHSKYQKYFRNFYTNQVFRQSYQTFIQSCESKQILLSLGQISIALKKYLTQKANNFIVKVRADMTIDSSVKGIKRIMERLNSFIQSIVKQSKQQFTLQKMQSAVEADAIIPKFIANFTKQFYQCIEPCVYEKQQLSDVLEALQIIIQSSNQLQSKGINLSRDFKSLISHDLPMHMNKILQVVLEAFEDILKQDNQLYQFKFFDSLGSLGQEVQLLTPIKQGQYGKKCCSKKGILLINAFVIILQPLCDDKWIFLQQNVLRQLIQKISSAFQSNWNFWDYYQLFYFFQRLKNGKIKHKRLFNQQQMPPNLKQIFSAIQKLSIECWQNFQVKITNKLWLQVLSNIPKNMWQNKDYYQIKAEAQQKPTIFGIELVFAFQNFLKFLQFRLQKTQFDYLISRFFEYALFTIQYVLYIQYHSRGTKQKVFSLYKKSQKVYKKAKMLALEELDIIKQQKKVLKIGNFTQTGVRNFALDIYFFTDCLKFITDYQKLVCEPFVQKVSQIQSKQHKSDPINVSKDNFSRELDSCVKVYKEQPEKIRQYMQKKKKQLSKNKNA